MITIKLGPDMDEKYLEQLYELDKIAYDQKYIGSLQNMVTRWKKNKLTFVSVEINKKPVAYINLFPCSKKLTEDILYNSDEILDDEIGITCYIDENFKYNDENNLYIISVVNSLSNHTFLAEMKNIKNNQELKQEVSKQLVNGYYLLLARIKENYRIENIFATTVSIGGQKWVSKIGLKEFRKLSDGNIVYKN